MKLILELDSDELKTGFVTATKVGHPGHRKGKVPIQAVIDLLGEVFNWEVAGRKVELISRLTESPLLAIGQNGPKWVAVKTIGPAEYFLVSATGKAYKVNLPRLAKHLLDGHRRVDGQHQDLPVGHRQHLQRWAGLHRDDRAQGEEA
jgi:hypothetical protein